MPSCLVIKVGCITFIVRVVHFLLSVSWCGFFGFRWCAAVFSFGSGWSLHVQSFAVSLDRWSPSVHFFIPCCMFLLVMLVKKLRWNIKTPVLVISTGNFIYNYPLYKSAKIISIFDWLIQCFHQITSMKLEKLPLCFLFFQFNFLHLFYLFIFVSFVEILP